MKPSYLLIPLVPALAIGLFLLAPADEKKPVAELKAEAPAANLKAPAKFTNSTPYPPEHSLPVPNRLPVARKIHEIVVKKGGPKAEGEMKNYEEVVPRSNNAKFKMVALKGGEVLLGSPETEEDRDDSEGPQRKVRIEPFWIGETEMQWAAYEAYYQNGVARRKDGTLLAAGEDYKVTHKGGKKGTAKEEAAKLLRGDANNIIDVVTQPTPQYMDMFLSGQFKNDLSYPAMTMTHHAASKFCKWLSAQTGHFYRLPTEAEWEFACRAGTTTAYSFGDDPAKLDDYAWHYEISDDTYHPVKAKKPNAWGLYDMHGNVGEWVLDGLSADFRKNITDGALNPWNISITRYPRIVKGGSWDSDPADLRVAARLESEKGWKDTDPQVPKSIWYHTDAQFVGFRVVRPLKTPTAEEMHLYWNTDWWEPARNGEDL